MQQDRIHFLQGLVQASKILSSDEKNSWLAMLPQLTEQQATELETILGEDHKTSASPQTVHPPARESDVPKPARIPLSHLQNLPSAAAFGNPITVGVGMVEFPQKKQTQALPGSEKKFSMHLREVLSEKELASGHQGEKFLNASFPKPQHTLQAVVPPPVVKPLSPVSAPPLPPRPPLAQATKIPSVPNSFFNSPPRPPKAPSPVLATAAAAAPGRTEVAYQAPSREDQTPIRDVSLQTLQDITSLSLNAFRGIPATALIVMLQRMVKKFGYFDVLFALEHSPLYQKYIEAGSAVLTQNISFVQFSQQNPGELALKMNKDEFEAMADVLRQLQKATVS